MSGVVDPMDEKRNCISCNRAIDAMANLCPYCGANPKTGEKFDPTPIVKEHFPPRKELSAIERAFGFLRARQGIFVTVVAIAGVVTLGAIHRWAATRNANQRTDVPAISLTEVADLANKRANADRPIPDMKFTYDGNAKTMQTFLLEPGAVAPGPTLAAGQPGGIGQPQRLEPTRLPPALSGSTPPAAPSPSTTTTPTPPRPQP